MNRRILTYGAAFGLTLGVIGFIELHVHGFERELQAIADQKIADFKSEEPPESLDELRIGASVVASKSYVLFGDLAGKVSVFLEHHIEDEEHFEGFEFFYAHEPDTGWVQTESGVCSSEECTQEGLRVLRRLDE